ncbi:MAG TPA: hypothetical protein VF553_19395 [Pyrinomonadaceae bacterium]
MTNTYGPKRHALRSFPSNLRSTFDSKASIRLLLVGIALALACIYASRPALVQASPSSCECNRNAPDVIYARWKPNSTLRVMLNRGDFSPAEIAAFQESIRLWQAVLPESGTGIDLQMGGEIAGNNCTGCIIVKRKADVGGTFAALYLLSTQGELYTKAIINIKADVHKTVMLRMLLTHELGHAFGLDDCEECDGDTTVMNSVNKYAFGKLAFLAPRSKMAAAPTRCDVALVARGYSGANARLGAHPAAQAPRPIVAQARIQPRAIVNTRPQQAQNARPQQAQAATPPAARHHANRVAGQLQSPVRTGQLVLMDALSRRDR